MTQATLRAGDVVELTSELVAVPSENPGGDERAVADLIRELCSAFDFPTPRLIGSADRPNLVTEVRFGSGGRNLGLCGHLDTKPVGEGAWETDPLSATVVDGELRGRGVADMKGALAAMMLATARTANEEPGRGAVTLIFCADEEYGARHGARLFTASDLSGVDAIVIGEPGGIHHDWDRLHLGSRGICNFDIEVTTRQAHSGLRDALGLVSATEAAARLVVALADFTPAHPSGGPAPTVNPAAVIRGGISYGVVPGRAVVSSECRLVAGMERAVFQGEVDDLVTAHLLEGAEARVEVQDWIPATAVSADDPVVEAARRAVATVTGSAPPDDLFPATTDATWFDALGIPTLPALGPALLSHAHAPDEAVSLDALGQAVDVYAALIGDYALGRDL